MKVYEIDNINRSSEIKFYSQLIEQKTFSQHLDWSAARYILTTKLKHSLEFLEDIKKFFEERERERERERKRVR